MSLISFLNSNKPCHFISDIKENLFDLQRPATNQSAQDRACGPTCGPGLTRKRAGALEIWQLVGWSSY